MKNFVFTSPGYKFRERDLSFVTRNVGITTAGLVGETPQGPAFEEVYLESIKEYTQIFGEITNERNRNGELKYQLGFAAKSFLEESNQLWVTRVLGLSGYDAGKAWGITINAGHDLSTVTESVVGTTSNPFTNGIYVLPEDEIYIGEVGQTGETISNFVRINNVFEATKYEYEVESLVGDSGSISITETKLTAQPLSEYEGMVVAIIRSKGDVDQEAHGDETYTWSTNKIEISNNNTSGGDLFENFTLLVNEEEYYTVSLNPKNNFIRNVLGSSPQSTTNPNIWVEAVYPELITKLYNEGWAYSVSDVVDLGDSFNDYNVKFQTPETPWIVSQLKGDKVDKLFKFISISDGDSANKQIKISIENINFDEYTFDVIIRNYHDKDNNTNMLESFMGCDLNPDSSNYIGKRIGTSDGYYKLRSRYVSVELVGDVDMYSVPSGFEGYNIYNMNNTPEIQYNTEYEDINDPRLIRNEYLGISENAFVGKGGIDGDFFRYMGENSNKKTKGFHFDSDLHGSGLFTTTSNPKAKFQKREINDFENPYFNIETRKFTVAPAGGFDGWNVYRKERTNTDNYRKGGIYNSDIQNPKPTDHIAWLNAIDTFSNPESITINLLATPGINWSKHTTLVKHTIDMVENDRTDTLYVVDSPDINIPFEIGGGGDKVDVQAAKNVVDLLEISGIDSNFACTYFPWVQMRNNNDFIPPTGEVLKSFATTDKIDYPWFAVAGLNRGIISVEQPRYRLSQPAKDILYKGRINPIAEYADFGTAIFGQKTLQIKDTALTRINVRRLILQIKVLISNIAIRMVFEQGDNTLMEDFLKKVNPILEDIRKNRGLLDFRVKMDSENNTPETLDRNELYGEIFLKPTRAIEYIGITFTVTPTGASFEDFGA